MGDDDSGAPDEVRKLVKGEEVDTRGARRPDRRRAVLHDELLAEIGMLEDAQEAIERDAAAPGRDEDHLDPRTLPA
jgi:hypothetical protein